MLKALGRDVAIYGAGEFVFKFIAFAVFPVYAHIFSVAQFGTWALLTTTATLLGFFVNLGVNQAVQRYFLDAGTSAADQPRVVSTGLFQLILSSVAVVGAILLAAQFVEGAMAERFGIDRLLLFLALVAVIPDQLLQFCLDVLRMQFTPARFLLLAFAKNMLGTAAALWLVVAERAGLHGLFLGLLVGSIAALPVGLWLIRRQLVWKRDRRFAGALFAFGFPLTFASIASWIYSSTDRWLLAALSSPNELGLYSVAAKYSTVITFVIAAFAQAWIPFALRMSRDEAGHAHFFGRVLSLWYFLLALMALALALYAPEALRLLTPQPYWGAARMLPMLAAGLVLFGTTQVTALGIALANRTVLTTWATAAAALANLVLNLLWIPALGGIGSAAATLVSYGLLTGMMLYWSQKLKPIPLRLGALAYCTFLTGLAASLSFVVLPSGDAASVLIKALVVVLVALGGVATGIVDWSMFRSAKPGDASWQSS